MGSFFIGLLIEALILQGIAFSLAYRASILMRFMAGFKTFSSFLSGTIYLKEEGSLAKKKAGLNVQISAWPAYLPP